MNYKQKFIIFIGIGFLLLNILFPPCYQVTGFAFRNITEYIGYKFIFNIKPDDFITSYKIMHDRVIYQGIIILITFGVIFYFLKEKNKAKNNN